MIFILKETASAVHVRGMTQITVFAAYDLQASILLIQLWAFQAYFWSANNLRLLSN